MLVVNAGSSSLKLSLLEPARGTEDQDHVLAARELDAPRAQVDPRELESALRSPLGRADAVGYRIVHGGERYREAVQIDEQVRRELGALVDLAPLHQPKSLAALDAVSAVLPDLPAVACFDTAFHATLPAAAATYALPAQWRERWGLRRYGFHGLSHAWVARRAPQLLARDPSQLRIVSCHLGAGASLCAIAAGRSLDTTMGFTPLEGLVMATRSGSVDPGLLVWLLERGDVPVGELADALEHRSGLLALAGVADMAEVVRRADEDDDEAQLALDVYIHRLCGGIATMAAALGGLDALVFTGGVGEHSPAVRARATQRLGFLGVAIETSRNQALGAGGHAELDADVSAPGASVHTLVLHTREDAEIARQTRVVLTQIRP